MRKCILCLTIALFIVGIGKAQEFEVGTNVINAGIGFGGYYGFSIGSGVSESPVFSVSYERGIWDIPGPGVVSLGGFFGRKTFEFDDAFGNDLNWSYTTIGFRGAYHYTGLEVENLDVYGGVMVHYDIFSGDDFDDYDSRPSATPFVGARWFFGDSFAAFAEGSYGVAFLTLGASFRF
ncbi:MAG: hypothetical protein AAGA86_15220 [Bacteroidota bacterium]